VTRESQKGYHKQAYFTECLRIRNNAIVSVYYRKLFRIMTTYRKHFQLNNAVVGGKHFGAESFRIAILCMKTSNYYQYQLSSLIRNSNPSFA
jgi:hypothetical protein